MMFKKTYLAYKSILVFNASLKRQSKKKYVQIKLISSIALFFVLLIFTSLSVYQIKAEIQAVLLSILSIIFPLIIGFLTFGLDLLIKTKAKIKAIKEKDDNDVGIPETKTDKNKINYLYTLSQHFISVIVNSFQFSFLLITILIVSNFFNFEYISTGNIYDIKGFILVNGIVIMLKIVFFFCVYIMLLNTLFVMTYISSIYKNENIINKINEDKDVLYAVKHLEEKIEQLSLKIEQKNN